MPDRLLPCSIAALDPKDKTDIDYKKVSDPEIAPQGAKNLRDRFRRLMESAEKSVREEKGMDEEDEVAFAGSSTLPSRSRRLTDAALFRAGRHHGATLGRVSNADVAPRQAQASFEGGQSRRFAKTDKVEASRLPKGQVEGAGFVER